MVVCCQKIEKIESTIKRLTDIWHQVSYLRTWCKNCKNVEEIRIPRLLFEPRFGSSGRFFSISALKKPSWYLYIYFMILKFTLQIDMKTVVKCWWDFLWSSSVHHSFLKLRNANHNFILVNSIVWKGRSIRVRSYAYNLQIVK